MATAFRLSELRPYFDNLRNQTSNIGQSTFAGTADATPYVGPDSFNLPYDIGGEDYGTLSGSPEVGAAGARSLGIGGKTARSGYNWGTEGSYLGAAASLLSGIPGGSVAGLIGGTIYDNVNANQALTRQFAEPLTGMNWLETVASNALPDFVNEALGLRATADFVNQGFAPAFDDAAWKTIGLGDYYDVDWSSGLVRGDDGFGGTDYSRAIDTGDVFSDKAGGLDDEDGGWDDGGNDLGGLGGDDSDDGSDGW